MSTTENPTIMVAAQQHAARKNDETSSKEGSRQPILAIHHRGKFQGLLANVPFTDRPCKCKSTKCLKLYCDCFRGGSFCDEMLCRCKECSNNEAHNEARGERQSAIKRILARRPGAFGMKTTKKRTGCGCKKG